jgi:hypothetical protein
VFEQLAQIPEEVLGDASVQSSIHSLLAMIGEQTGNAFIIGLSALPEITKEQLDEALGIYDQWKKDIEDPEQPNSMVAPRFDTLPHIRQKCKVVSDPIRVYIHTSICGCFFGVRSQTPTHHISPCLLGACMTFGFPVSSDGRTSLKNFWTLRKNFSYMDKNANYHSIKTMRIVRIGILMLYENILSV